MKSLLRVKRMIPSFLDVVVECDDPDEAANSVSEYFGDPVSILPVDVADKSPDIQIICDCQEDDDWEEKIVHDARLTAEHPLSQHTLWADPHLQFTLPEMC